VVGYRAPHDDWLPAHHWLSDYPGALNGRVIQPALDGWLRHANMVEGRGDEDVAPGLALRCLEDLVADATQRGAPNGLASLSRDAWYEKLVATAERWFSSSTSLPDAARSAGLSYLAERFGPTRLVEADHERTAAAFRRLLIALGPESTATLLDLAYAGNFAANDTLSASESIVRVLRKPDCPLWALVHLGAGGTRRMTQIEDAFLQLRSPSQLLILAHRLNSIPLPFGFYWDDLEFGRLEGFWDPVQHIDTDTRLQWTARAVATAAVVLHQHRESLSTWGLGWYLLALSTGLEIAGRLGQMGLASVLAHEAVWVRTTIEAVGEDERAATWFGALNPLPPPHYYSEVAGLAAGLSAPGPALIDSVAENPAVETWLGGLPADALFASGLAPDSGEASMIRRGKERIRRFVHDPRSNLLDDPLIQRYFGQGEVESFERGQDAIEMDAACLLRANAVERAVRQTFPELRDSRRKLTMGELATHLQSGFRTALVGRLLEAVNSAFPDEPAARPLGRLLQRLIDEIRNPSHHGDAISPRSLAFVLPEAKSLEPGELAERDENVYRLLQALDRARARRDVQP
jgi:hypothetical protein